MPMLCAYNALGSRDLAGAANRTPGSSGRTQPAANRSDAKRRSRAQQTSSIITHGARIGDLHCPQSLAAPFCAFAAALSVSASFVTPAAVAEEVVDALATVNSNSVPTAVLVDADGTTAAAARPREATTSPAARDENRQVYFEFKVDGRPAGQQLVVELYRDVPVGAERFFDLAVGREGVSYKLSKVTGISRDYLQTSGVARLSYSATESSPIAGGDSVLELERELRQHRHGHDTAGTVSLEVKTQNEPSVKTKLVAMNGKLVEVKEQLGSEPNGTAFVITTSAAPQLDDTHLVVGRVVQGYPLVQELAQLPIVKDNTNSPFFRAAKLAGDKRADVAEQGFNRPFAKVVISKSGAV